MSNKKIGSWELKCALILLSLLASPSAQSAPQDRCPPGSIKERLSGLLGSMSPRVKPNGSGSFEFKIPEAQIQKARGQVDRQLISESHFIIPSNDGEAVRAADILRAVNAPHLDAKKLPWGAKLDEIYKTPEDIQKNFITPLKAKGVKRVVIFELPAPNLEKALKDAGLEVVIIDHHKYQGLDRYRDESSIEQLMDLVKWPKSRTDEAIAVNDRGYIPGLRKMGLSDDEIRAIRAYDYRGQGKTADQIEKSVREAQALIPSLKQRDGVFILDLPPHLDEALFKEELAIQGGDRVVSSIEVRPQKIGFSGDPKVVDSFLNRIDYEKLGYAKEDIVKYGGGDPKASMFFGFKPKNPPKGHKDLVPPHVVDAFWNAVGDAQRLIQIASQGTVLDAEVQAAGLLPRGSAIITSSGKLADQGITQIIHAATGSMNRTGPKFDPTAKSVADSIHNSLDLARSAGHQRVAVPFIGGKIFVERIGISPQELVNRIVETAIKNRGNLELRFMTFGVEDTRLFNNALKTFGSSLSPTQAAVVDGSITDKSLHGASVIINAANMEAKFGGGLSGVIARATGESDKIDREAQDAIKKFWNTYSKDSKPGQATKVELAPSVPRAEKESNLSEILGIFGPRERVTALKNGIRGDRLSKSDLDQLIARAEGLSNRDEISEYLRIASESKDLRWLVPLESWIKRYSDYDHGWQVVTHKNAVDVYHAILSKAGGAFVLKVIRLLRMTGVPPSKIEVEGESLSKFILSRGVRIMVDENEAARTLAWKTFDVENDYILSWLFLHHLTEKAGRDEAVEMLRKALLFQPNHRNAETYSSMLNRLGWENDIEVQKLAAQVKSHLESFRR